MLEPEKAQEYFKQNIEQMEKMEKEQEEDESGARNKNLEDSHF